MPRRFYLWAASALVLVTVAAVSWLTAKRAGILAPSEPGTPPALASQLHQPVSDALMASLRNASRAGLQFRVANPADIHLQPISGPRLNAGSKVGVLYIGGEFCPYCAAQRWGLVLTLLRFGDVNGLRYMASSSTDSHPNTATMTFQHVQYQSKLVSLQAVEVWDRHNHKLMPLDAVQTKIFATYDAPPYTQYPGGIPFVYVDGHYMLTDLMLPASDLTGMNWQQVADALADPRSKLFLEIMPNVNLMTAAICQLDGGNPADVCNAPGVVAASHALPKPDAAKH